MLQDGIVGLRNDTFYCYMNACLQCLLAIEPLRDHFLNKDYHQYNPKETKRNNFHFCQQFDMLYQMVYSKSSKQKDWVVNPEIKKLVKRKFDPIT